MNHYKYKISSFLTFKVPTELWNQTSWNRTFWWDVGRAKETRFWRERNFHLEKKTQHTETNALLYSKKTRELWKQNGDQRVRRFHDSKESKEVMTKHDISSMQRSLYLWKEVVCILWRCRRNCRKQLSAPPNFSLKCR
jgi:hypothetical protein